MFGSSISHNALETTSLTLPRSCVWTWIGSSKALLAFSACWSSDWFSSPTEIRRTSTPLTFANAAMTELSRPPEKATATFSLSPTLSIVDSKRSSLRWLMATSMSIDLVWGCSIVATLLKAKPRVFIAATFPGGNDFTFLIPSAHNALRSEATPQVLLFSP